MLLQLYFNDRKGALLTCAVYFAVNLLGTLFTMNRPPLYYGLGMTLAGMVMYLVGLIRLLVYVSHIDYHVFCGQPVLLARKEHWLGKLAAWLDARAGRMDRSVFSNADTRAE